MKGVERTDRSRVLRFGNTGSTTKATGASRPGKRFDGTPARRARTASGMSDLTNGDPPELMLWGEEQ